MRIGPRADSPVAYKFISAETSDELYGQPFTEHLIVHFESIYRDYNLGQESITMYKLSFFKVEDDVHLVSATLSPDRATLKTSSNS
jgi:hypothetical protein